MERGNSGSELSRLAWRRMQRDSDTPPQSWRSEGQQLSGEQDQLLLLLVEAKAPVVLSFPMSLPLRTHPALEPGHLVTASQAPAAGIPPPLSLLEAKSAFPTRWKLFLDCY